MENMNGFQPTWQLKPWVLLTLFAGVLLLLTSSCTTARHTRSQRASLQTISTSDQRTRYEEPYWSRVR